MKGISPILSQSIMISVTVLFIIMIVFMVNSISADYREFVGKNEIKEVCYLVRSGIENIYFPSGYQSSANAAYGKVTQLLPEKIAGMGYRARFSGSYLFLETNGETQLNYTCSLNFPAEYNGSSTGGLTEIKWIRYSDGKDLITMRRL